ncbi:MAG: transposase [Verrucomicrobia bacterium]|nr:transposase [Verrucomicrobiota bacterium]
MAARRRDAFQAAARADPGLVRQGHTTGRQGRPDRDIEAALVEALGVEQTGRSVISRTCYSLRADFARRQERDLSEHQVLYLSLDAIYLNLRPEDERAGRSCAPARSPWMAAKCCCSCRRGQGGLRLLGSVFRRREAARSE